jgi:hypothetical protein
VGSEMCIRDRYKFAWIITRWMDFLTPGWLEAPPSLRREHPLPEGNKRIIM